MIKQLAIVIPAYKATFLSAALDSIAEQTCQEFTLYIGDDCSPNHLEDIVCKYKDKVNLVYKRFESNLGGTDLVAQWERCIAMTQGEPYIWLFSDDDVMEPRCVEEFFNLSKEDRDNYLIHFDINTINSKGDILKSHIPYPKVQTAKEYLDGKLFEKRCVSFVVEFVFSRALYNKCSGFQNFDLAWGSDFITWLKMAGECRGIKSISGEKCRILWRSSDQNISPNKSKPILMRKLNATIETFAYIKEWLCQHGYNYSFKYSKFIWGEIKRNRSLLNQTDIDMLNRKYQEKIGVSFFSKLSYFLCKYYVSPTSYPCYNGGTRNPDVFLEK